MGSVSSSKIQAKYGAIAALLMDLADESISSNALPALALRAGGLCAQKDVTLTGSGASTENLFKIHGVIRLKGMYGVCTAVGDSTTFSGVKFELDDGTVQDDLTTAVDASGIVANGLLLKENDKTTPLDFFNPTAVTQVANVSKDVYDPIVVLQKTGDVDSFIRLAYTGDASTNITMSFFLRWVPLLGSSYIEVVA